MKKIDLTVITLFLTSFFIFTDMLAQNVGIGTNEPLEKLQVNGNLLIQQPYTVTHTPPTTAQTKTMVNGSSITFPNTDPTGRIYDPGGSAGNYSDNQTATAVISIGDPAIEVTVEDIDLNTGDSLIITGSGIAPFKVGNGYSTNGKYVFNTGSLTITFKSNGDGQTGRGFSLLFKRYYLIQSTPALYNVAGQAIYLDAAKGSIRGGLINTAAQTGFSSLAVGYNNEASGSSTTALGSNNVASGSTAIAVGFRNLASGSESIATGSETEASGNISTAMGELSLASGDNSIAMGYRDTASGDHSIAIGSYVSTNGFDGALVIGDFSSNAVLKANADNTFRARFAGGYRLYTNNTANVGVAIAAGGNSWVTISDMHKKENFEPINGEYFLQKISSFTLSSWNYKGQDAKTYRHYGPMAQDFHAAFGKDKYGTIGNDTTINQADFGGVNLIAIQALVKRTETLNSDNNVLKQQVATLQKKLDELNSAVIKRLQQLEALAIQLKGD